MNTPLSSFGKSLFLIIANSVVFGGLLQADDTRSAAINLGSQPVVTLVIGEINPTGDEDYFKFTAAGDYTAIIDVAFIHANGDIDMELQDDSGNLADPGLQLAVSQTTNDDEQIRFPVTAGTTYYVRLYGFSGATNPSYLLGLSTTTVVDNTSGGRGLGSLHDAIGGADALSGQFGINQDVTFNAVFGSIVLTERISEISNQVSIVGPGKTNLMVDGNGLFRHLRIGSGAVVNLSGLSFVNGAAIGPATVDEGGGSITNSGTLSITDTDFVGNRAIQVFSGGAGGAVLSEGPLTLLRCEFSQNITVVGSLGHTGSGGAIYSTGDITANDCLFINNATADAADGSLPGARGRNSGSGGVIDMHGGYLILKGCVFDSNRIGAGGDGANGGPGNPFGGSGGSCGFGSALSLSQTSFQIEECGFYRNTTGSGGDGGIASAGAIDGSFGTGGRAAISILASVGTSTSIMRNCTISENVGGPNGVGNASAHETSSGVLISSLSYVPLTVQMIHCTISNNSSPETILGGAAAVVANNVDPIEMEGCIIYGNTVDDGGILSAADLRGDTAYFGTNIVGTHLSGAALGPAPLNVDPLLGSLAANGGLGETQVPMMGSPAIDNALNGTNTPALDGRFLSRPYGNAPDLGAVETRRLVVNTFSDENDGISIGGISLRDAIDAFVFSGVPEEGVLFDPSVFVQGVSNTLTLPNGPIVVSGGNAGVVVDAASFALPDGSPGIVIDGVDTTRLFEIDATGDLTLNDIRISRGVSSVEGGGIRNAGVLRMNRCRVEDCRTLGNGSSSHGPASGGGIYSVGALFLTDCLLARNRSAEAGDGGAISCISAELIRCHFIGNTIDDPQSVTTGIPGDQGGFGGAVFSSGSILIDQCVFSGNRSGNAGKGGGGSSPGFGGNGGSGGALYIEGGTITRSLFQGNQCGSGGAGGDGKPTNPANGGPGGSGGAVYAFAASVVEIENCTFILNRTGLGGPLGDAQPGQTASGDGGAVFTEAGIALISFNHCTIVSNTGNGAGGISSSNSPGGIVIENTIVSGNLDENGSAADVEGDFSAEGANLIGVSLSGTVIGSGTVFNSDPLLAPFADYGGPTRCLFPYPSSPAVNAAVVTGGSPAVDQRGHYRAVGSAPDIGAVESDIGLIITDGDGDGMDDFWEGLHGLMVGINDSLDDGDGDGSPNGEEFGNHTNPRDPLSLFRITDFIPVGFSPVGHPRFELQWSSWPGLNYATEISTDLQQAWNPDQNLMGVAASLETVTLVVLPLPQHFVRVTR